MTDILRVACLDSEAPPLFHKSPDGVVRTGYEPAAAELVASVMGRRVKWVMVPWTEMIPAVQNHEADAVWCGQSIIPSRQELVDFTRPYGIFHEGVLVRSGSGISSPADLVGRRIAAIEASVNMKLAESFDGAIPVSFGSEHEDVFAAMLEALLSGDVDGVVDDDLVFVPLADDPRFELPIVVETANRWGVGVAKDRPVLLIELDAALAIVIADGRLQQVWDQWLPSLDFPFSSGD